MSCVMDTIKYQTYPWGESNTWSTIVTGKLAGVWLPHKNK